MQTTDFVATIFDGEGNPNKVTVAFAMALNALMKGHSATLILMVDAVKLGTPGYMVDNAGELQAEWFAGTPRVGLTAGASAPDVLVQDVIQKIKSFGALSVRKMDGVQEHVKFPLPKSLVMGDE